MIVENIIPRNMIINLACTLVDNHIPRDDIFDYRSLRKCNMYILLPCCFIKTFTIEAGDSLFYCSMPMQVQFVYARKLYTKR